MASIKDRIKAATSEDEVEKVLTEALDGYGYASDKTRRQWVRLAQARKEEINDRGD